jgi:hypothetical protein
MRRRRDKTVGCFLNQKKIDRAGTLGNGSKTFVPASASAAEAEPWPVYSQ